MEIDQGVIVQKTRFYYIIATKTQFIRCSCSSRFGFKVGDTVKFDSYPIEATGQCPEEHISRQAMSLSRHSLGNVSIDVDNSETVLLTCRITKILLPNLDGISNYGSDFIEVLHSTKTTCLGGNQIIGKRAILKIGSRHNKPSWFIEKILEESCVEPSRELEGFIFHKDHRYNTLRVFVPGYPEHFVFSATGEVGRWIRFSIDPDANHNNEFVGLPEEVLQSAEPIQRIKEKFFKILAPCRRGPGPICPLSTMTFDVIDDEHHFLEQFGRRLNIFENVPLWLEFQPQFRSKIRFIISTHQPQLGDFLPPELPMSRPTAASNGDQIPRKGENVQQGVPRSCSIPDQVSSSQRSPNSNIGSNRPLRIPAYRRNAPEVSDRKPEAPRSKERNLDRSPVRVAQVATEVFKKPERATRRSAATSRHPPPESHRSGSTLDSHSSSNSLNSQGSRSPPRRADRSPVRCDWNTSEEPFIKPQRKEKASGSEDVSSSPVSDEESEVVRLRREVDRLKQERNFYKATHDALQEDYVAENELHDIIRRNNFPLSEKLLKLVTRPFPN